MSKLEKFLNQNEKGKMIYYSSSYLMTKRKTEILGFKESDIIEKYGSVEKFEELELNNPNKSYLIHNYQTDNLEVKDLFPKYELEFETDYTSYDHRIDGDYEEMEEVKGFDIDDGEDYGWIGNTKKDEELLIEWIKEECRFNQNLGHWEELGTDLGIETENRTYKGR